MFNIRSQVVLSRSELVGLWRSHSDRSQGKKTTKRRQIDLRSRKRMLAKITLLARSQAWTL